MSVIIRVDTVGATESESRIFLLELLVQSYHRRIQIREFPAVLCCRFLLVFYDSFDSLIFGLEKIPFFQLNSFVIRRSSQHYNTCLGQFLETLFHLLVVLNALLIFLFPKFLRFITIVFKVSGVIHTECNHQYGRLHSKNICIQTFVHVKCRISSDTAIEYTNRHIRKTRHIIQPDV